MHQEDQKVKEKELWRRIKREETISGRFAVVAFLMIFVGSIVLPLVLQAMTESQTQKFILLGAAAGWFLIVGLPLMKIANHFQDLAGAIHKEWELLVGKEELSRRYMKAYVRHWSGRR